jgi:hypothetical protein
VRLRCFRERRPATKTPPKRHQNIVTAAHCLLPTIIKMIMSDAPVAHDLCGGLKRSLKIIGGGLEDF